jgi:hypothetical protein
MGDNPVVVQSAAYFLIGSTDEIVDTLEARREHFGISCITVFGDRYTEDFAPVVARLAGK